MCNYLLKVTCCYTQLFTQLDVPVRFTILVPINKNDRRGMTFSHAIYASTTLRHTVAIMFNPSSFLNVYCSSSPERFFESLVNLPS